MRAAKAVAAAMTPIPTMTIISCRHANDALASQSTIVHLT